MKFYEELKDSYLKKLKADWDLKNPPIPIEINFNEDEYNSPQPKSPLPPQSKKSKKELEESSPDVYKEDPLNDIADPPNFDQLPKKKQLEIERKRLVKLQEHLKFERYEIKFDAKRPSFVR